MYSGIAGVAGYQSFNDFNVPENVQRHQLGLKLIAHDPYWGLGTFIYGKSAGTILKGSVVVFDEAMNATLVANTANLGYPLAVSMSQASSGVFFWSQVEGLAVYKTNATVAADAAIGIAAAGILGTNSAGKQVLGIRNRIAATGTVVKAGTRTYAGLGYIDCPNGYDGWFLGMVLTGTGMAASTVVAGLDPDGRRVYMGSAIGVFGDKLATATGTVSITGTYTGYGAGIIYGPFAQGAIT